jgi:hypothetical protein
VSKGLNIILFRDVDSLQPLRAKYISHRSEIEKEDVISD